MLASFRQNSWVFEAGQQQLRAVSGSKPKLLIPYQSALAYFM